MTETFEELDKNLVTAITKLSKVVREYTERFVSTSPLNAGPIPEPNFTYAEIKDATDRIQVAEAEYHEAARRMQEFRNRGD